MCSKPKKPAPAAAAAAAPPPPKPGEAPVSPRLEAGGGGSGRMGETKRRMGRNQGGTILTGARGLGNGSDGASIGFTTLLGG